MEADFSGYATKAGVECTDGRTIMPGAFRHQDKQQVPLVWQHGHTNPENVLGHVLLEDRTDGVYAYGFFNGTEKANHIKEALSHKDINSLSIWANGLIERAGKVVHGAIREVSLVLSGANPGALIENVTLRHSDGNDEILEDEAILKFGEELDEVDIEHADGEDGGDTTIQDVYNSMSPEQKDVLHFMIAQAVEDSTAGHSNTDDDGSAEHSNTDDQEGNNTMSRNVFEQDGASGAQTVNSEHAQLVHDNMGNIFAQAEKLGSLKAAVQEFGLQHGINDISTLFPEATALTAAPEFWKRRMEWVNVVLGGARKTPFSRIKTHWADLNWDDARAKGYVTGNMKKEEFFGTARRETTPTTVYKKQKLDRDDIIDITDFDVVTWMKGEMRVMLDEEIARAVLVGDGRDVADEDKINEARLRPIATDDDLFTIKVNVNLDDANSTVQEVIDALILSRQHYRGSGQPTMFCTETLIAQFMLLKDGLGRRMYRSLDELRTELRLSAIVPVEVMEGYDDLAAIVVNMSDYAIGADRGGQVTMFDDFDIDYNKYTYLIETRISGALTKLKSAMVLNKVGATDTLVSPTAPTYNNLTGVTTIPSVTGVTYQDEGGTPYTPGAQSPVTTEGADTEVYAVADTGYYFANSEKTYWKFTYRAQVN